MALEFTHPLTEMSTRRIFGGKCGRCVRLTTLPSSSAVVMKSGNLNFLEPCGPLQACNGTDLLFIYNITCFGPSHGPSSSIEILCFRYVFLWGTVPCKEPKYLYYVIDISNKEYSFSRAISIIMLI